MLPSTRAPVDDLRGNALARPAAVGARLAIGGTSSTLSNITEMRGSAVFVALAMWIAAIGVATASADPYGTVFNSPTGNIHCYGSATVIHGKKQPAYVVCTLAKERWAHPPRRPTPCNGDFVPTEFDVFFRSAEAGICRSDAVPFCETAHCRVLQYGSHLDFGPIRCVSRYNGMTCRNKHGTQAGFRIAIQDYRLWPGVRRD
jgi:hypothetical protein